MRARRRITTVAPSVGPLGIAGCVLWLRADMGVTKDGSDKVSAWADQSGQGHHATQGTGGKQPTWLANGYNGRAGILGNAAASTRLVANWSQAQPTTTCIAFYGPAPGTNETLVDGGGGAINSLRLYGAGGSAYTLHCGTGLGSIACPTGAYVVTMVANGATSSLRKDGASGGDGAAGAASSNGVCLFSAGDDRFYSAATILEVTQWSRALSSDEYQRVERYMGARYGIAVA